MIEIKTKQYENLDQLSCFVFISIIVIAYY